MGKKEDKQIIAKLDPSLQPGATNVLNNPGVRNLLEFGTFHHGQTTSASRDEIRAVLLTAINQGTSLQAAGTLKESLRTAAPQETTDLLKRVNNNPGDTQAVLRKHLTEYQMGAQLTPVNPAALQDVNIDSTAAITVNVTPQTGQNLQVAQSINFTVKSLINDGAPNQAPDVLRTGGRNFLLDKDRNTNGSKLLKGLDKDKQYLAECARADTIDKLRGGLDTLSFGEGYNNVVTKSQGTVAVGTGKCGEHAVTTFSMLTDPQSLAKLGVEIADGSTVMLVRGDMIDHSYVLIAGPDAGYTLAEDGDRRVTFTNTRDVVVVDPWMPLPVAHTLDRCNSEIQVTMPAPMCKMAVKIQGGQAVILDRNNKQTIIPPPTVPVLDQLNSVKDNYRESILKLADKEGIVPRDPSKKLAVACGQATSFSVGKAGMYHDTQMSSNTPGDVYQTVSSNGTNIGTPTSYFVADQKYLAEEHNFIQQAKQTSIKSLAFKPENIKLMPDELRTRVEIVRDNPPPPIQVTPPNVAPTIATQPQPQVNQVNATTLPGSLPITQPQGLAPTSPKVERINSTTRATPRVRDDLEKVNGNATPKADRINSNTRAKPRLRDAHPELAPTKGPDTGKKLNQSQGHGQSH